MFKKKKHDWRNEYHPHRRQEWITLATTLQNGGDVHMKRVSVCFLQNNRLRFRQKYNCWFIAAITDWWDGFLSCGNEDLLQLNSAKFSKIAFSVLRKSWAPGSVRLAQVFYSLKLFMKINVRPFRIVNIEQPLFNSFWPSVPLQLFLSHYNTKSIFALQKYHRLYEKMTSWSPTQWRETTNCASKWWRAENALLWG